MLAEIALVVIMFLPFLYVVIVLAREGEAEYVEGLDECPKHWEAVKEEWD